jgi:nucleotide-binding universal stress UspA family protein
MRWKAPRPPLRSPRAELEEATAEGGPTDTATVVVGIDGLPESWDAFCWACHEARRLGGRAVGVFISPAARTGLPAAAGYRSLDRAATEQASELLSAMLREAGDLDLTFVDAPGDPVPQLLRVAREVHADVLVVGRSTGRRFTGAVGQRLLGQRLVARRRRSVIAIVPSTSGTLTTCCGQ